MSSLLRNLKLSTAENYFDRIYILYFSKKNRTKIIIKTTIHIE